VNRVAHAPVDEFPPLAVSGEAAAIISSFHCSCRLPKSHGSSCPSVFASSSGEFPASEDAGRRSGLRAIHRSRQVGHVARGGESAAHSGGLSDGLSSRRPTAERLELQPSIALGSFSAA
jgi:hypothetical protein